MRFNLKQVFSDQTKKSSFINILLKPVSIILGVAYTPILLNYLGDERYGLWSTILSVISWVNYFDVGIGHGLRNLLTSELTRKQYEEAKKSVSTAYVVLSIIAFALLVVSMGSVVVLNWGRIFNTEIDMRAPLAISFAFICVNFILALSNTLLYALQLSERVALRGCLVQIFNIAGILIISQFSSGNIVLVSFLFGMSTMTIYIYNTYQIFQKHEFLRPNFSYFRSQKISNICNTGLKFFVIQIDCLALYTVDNLLITHLFGAVAVTPFNIVYRVFSTCYAFLSALCIPYWSKSTEAITRGDFEWVKRSVKHLYLIAIASCIGYFIVVLVFKPVTYVWLGRNLDYPDGLALVMCIYYCLYSVVTVSVQFINGSGAINFQLVLMTIMGVLNIPFSVFLAKNCGLGVVGIRLATTILMAVAAVAFPINLRIIIKNMEAKRQISTGLGNSL